MTLLASLVFTLHLTMGTIRYCGTRDNEHSYTYSSVLKTDLCTRANLPFGSTRRFSLSFKQDLNSIDPSSSSSSTQLDTDAKSFAIEVGAVKEMTSIFLLVSLFIVMGWPAATHSDWLDCILNQSDNSTATWQATTYNDVYDGPTTKHEIKTQFFTYFICYYILWCDFYKSHSPHAIARSRQFV